MSLANLISLDLSALSTILQGYDARITNLSEKQTSLETLVRANHESTTKSLDNLGKQHATLLDLIASNSKNDEQMRSQVADLQSSLTKLDDVLETVQAEMAKNARQLEDSSFAFAGMQRQIKHLEKAANDNLEASKKE
jgi:chromosome segregation ATPase